MNGTGEHPVARIDDTVTAENLHARAEAVAVPDFNYLEQMVEGIAAGLTRRRRHRQESTTTCDPAVSDER